MNERYGIGKRKGELENEEGIYAMLHAEKRDAGTAESLTPWRGGAKSMEVRVTSDEVRSQKWRMPRGPAEAGRTNVECQTSNVRPLGFSSKEYDTASGLSYYGFRYYDPASARWMNKDPIEWCAGLHLYRHVYNSPIMFFDVYGLFGFDNSCDCYYKSDEEKSRIKQLVNQALSVLKQRMASKRVSARIEPANEALVSCIDKWVASGKTRVHCAAGFTGRRTTSLGSSAVGFRTDMPEKEVTIYPKNTTRGWEGAVIIHEIAHACSWRHGFTGNPGGSVVPSGNAPKEEVPVSSGIVPGQSGNLRINHPNAQ